MPIGNLGIFARLGKYRLSVLYKGGKSLSGYCCCLWRCCYGGGDGDDDANDDDDDDGDDEEEEEYLLMRVFKDGKIV
ncbi:hypothetical protein DPMN_102409 [Dreissena polymorpha]|uniref:Uncharacterized protein n=1 Tax=Dreissena polymorpha TaxID=45954 RepID=A0A9D4RAH6_DREPO|nr:hypothetical protein DPMN_102409 [Dreissena polymorpha]